MSRWVGGWVGGTYLGQRVGKTRVLRGVPPPRPHGIHLPALGDLDDEHDVGVVVVVGACLSGWVGGWLSKLCIHRKMEEIEAVEMRCCRS